MTFLGLIGLGRFALRLIAPLLLYALPALLLIWALSRWIRDKERFESPRWRNILTLGAFTLAAGSTLSWWVSLIWAQAIHGFPFYDPALLRFIRFGFLSAALGLVTALFGKGKLRWPTVGLSGLMSLYWLGAATGE